MCEMPMFGDSRVEDLLFTSSRAHGPRRARPRGMSVALVGADGAGKSTVASLLESAELPAPVKRIYMGVNLEASSMVLPTTWLLLVVKRLRGGRPDLLASALSGQSGAGSWRRSAKNTARMTVWMLEEWLRQLISSAYLARGRIVVYDRHFFADYYATDVAGTVERGFAGRLHGWMLARLYPKPDLVICLDAPGEVLFRRKAEADSAWLERRRMEFLALADVVPAFVLVDAQQSLDRVCAEVVASVSEHWKQVHS